jgi:hypothetical protein
MTPTATFTITPNATPVATGTPIAEKINPLPVLAAAMADGGSVILTWTYASPLASDEWFDVRVWNETNGSATRGVANVKQSSYPVGAGFVYGPGTYNWTVAVIRRLSNGSSVTLASAGQTLRFTWTSTGPRCRTYPNC